MNIELPFYHIAKLHLGTLLKLDAVFSAEMLVSVLETTLHFIRKD